MDPWNIIMSLHLALADKQPISGVCTKKFYSMYLSEAFNFFVEFFEIIFQSCLFEANGILTGNTELWTLCCTIKIVHLFLAHDL